MLSNKERHDTTKLGPNAVQELKINQRRILIDSLEIGIPAPEQMIALGERQLPNGIKVGQLLNSKTLNYKKFTPHRDGLFCERIFGPVQSFVCACGKRKESVQNKSRQKDLVRTKLLPEVGEAKVTPSFQKEALFCPKCQVEYISKNVRRHRLGYIKLFAPVTHIWYLKGRPSYLSLFLGKRKKAITSLAYCNAYLVEQVYSNLETKNQVKDTGRFVSQGVTKLKQNQALSAFAQTNNVKLWQNLNNQSEKKEDYQKVALEESVLSSLHEKHLQPRTQFLGNKVIKELNKNEVTGVEPFFSLLEQLFPERHVKNLSFSKKSETIKEQNVNINKVFYFNTERTKTSPKLAFSLRYRNKVFVNNFVLHEQSSVKKANLTKSKKNIKFLLKQDIQRCYQKSAFLPAFVSFNKRYAGLIRPSLFLTKRYKAVTKLVSWLKLPPERSLYKNVVFVSTIHERSEQDGSQNTQLSGNQKKVNQSLCKNEVFATGYQNGGYKTKVFVNNALQKQSFYKQLCNTTTSIVPKSTNKFLLTSYVRAQTSPFLPSLICSFHLRDCLISFLQSSPRAEDIPIPLYCQTQRRYPLRDVHKFLTEFGSTTTKEKAERLNSESIKRFTGLPTQAKPILNKDSCLPNRFKKAIGKAQFSLKRDCRNVVVYEPRHANLLSRNKIDVFTYKIPTKKHKIDEIKKRSFLQKGTPSAYLLSMVSSVSIRKPNVTAKTYNQGKTFTKLKVSALAVNLEGVNHVFMKKAGFLQKVIGNQKNKHIGENGRYRQLKGSTKQSENLLMPTQFLAQKTTMSGILLNTFINMLLPETTPILCRSPLLRHKRCLGLTPFTGTKLQNQITFATNKVSGLQKNSVKIKSNKARTGDAKPSFLQPVTSYKIKGTKRTVQKLRFCNKFFSFVSDVKTSSSHIPVLVERHSRYFYKTSTHNALVKAKLLPMHSQSQHKESFKSDFFNFQLIAAGSRFRNQAKLCKKNVPFTNIEKYQTRLLYLVFGTLFQNQLIESHKSITNSNQSAVSKKTSSKNKVFVFSLLPFYSAFKNNYYSSFVKRDKEVSSSSEQFFPHSFDLIKPKLIARLYPSQECISQNKNISFKIYSSHLRTSFMPEQGYKDKDNVFVNKRKNVVFGDAKTKFSQLVAGNELRFHKEKSEKGVTSLSCLSLTQNIQSNGVFTVSFSIDLPFFISGSKQNRVCFIAQKENQVEWTTSGESTSLTSYAPYADLRELNVKKDVKSEGYSKASVKETNCSVTSNTFISSSLPDVNVWTCTLVKRFLINSRFNNDDLNKNEVFVTDHSCVSSSGSLAKTCVEQTYASKLRTTPHKLYSERYVKTDIQSNVVPLPEMESKLQGSALSENLVRFKQKPFVQSTKALTNIDRIKENSRSFVGVSEGEAFTQSISKWHINGAKEILLYTGGGALESLLKRFNISLFCQFLFGEIQILRKYYKDQVVVEYSKSKKVDEHKNSSSEGLNEYTYLRKNEVDSAFYVPKHSYDLVKTTVKTEIKELSDVKTKSSHIKVTPERHFGLKSVGTDKNANLFCRRIYRTTRRLKIVQLLMRSKRRPEWMMISVLPVLPPDLRPVLQMGENLIVASDLNTLYQRVIYRNNRHYKGRFLDFHFVSSIHRLVQDAVDRLIENGKGGSTPFLTPGGRPLKSLSDILKGKRGRFRFNLLGKRVDFSGRSVIVVSPNLKIHECGLPREMALELYKYLLIRQLLLKKQVSSIVNAKKLIKQRKPLIWDMLREIIYYHPLLLNRAPTLHRLGIQAFQPKLALGNAILLHPLVCAGFNADFDGDQMGVHLPLSPQARAEAWDLLWSRNNLLSPATGQPILLPSQDMVLGFYYMTALLPYGTTFRLANEDDQKTTHKNNVLKKQNFFKLPVVHVFSDIFQVVNAYQKKQIDIHTPIWLKRIGKSENAEKSQTPLELRIDIFGYGTQIYPTYKSKGKAFKDRNTSFLTFNKNKGFTEHIRTTVGRVLVNNLISQNN